MEHDSHSSGSAGSKTTFSWAGALTGRLAILLAAFIVITTMVVVVREYRVGGDRLVAETASTLSNQASTAADRLGAALAERLRLVALWASLETSQDLAVDDVDKRVSASLEDLVSTLGDGTEAAAARGGVLLASSDPARLGDRPQPLPGFVEEALQASAPAGLSLVPGLETGAVVATADVVSNVDGSSLGRIALWTSLSRFLSDAVPIELDAMELVGPGGLALARGSALSEPSGDYLWARDTIRAPGGPLELGIARPRAEVTEALRRSGRQLVTLAALFLLLALPASLLVARSSTAGLRRLTSAARELDARHPEPLPPVSRWAPSEVRVLAEAMQSMVERLKLARETLARSESLAAVGVLTKSLAHEIRTPLSVLRAGTEVLQRATEDGSREREIGEMLQAEVERLARLVDDLLVFGRPSPPRPQDADLMRVGTETVAALESDAQEKGVTLLLEGESTPLQADPGQLRQIVTNLVTNGIRACQAGGTVRISTRPMEGRAVVEVEDDGAGIPPEHLQEIWTPLFTTHRSGTGLGLPIVKQLLEAHGGDIEVKSVPGRGTVMRVTLPLQWSENG